MLRSLLVFFGGALRHSLRPEHVEEDCVKIGLAAPVAAVVAAQYREHLPGLSLSAAAQTVAVNKLVDLEWRFGVTASTDEMAQVGSTFLQLKLVVDKGGEREIVHLELSLPQFYQFLAQMERAQSVMSTL